MDKEHCSNLKLLRLKLLLDETVNKLKCGVKLYTINTDNLNKKIDELLKEDIGGDSTKTSGGLNDPTSVFVSKNNGFDFEEVVIPSMLKSINVLNNIFLNVGDIANNNKNKINVHELKPLLVVLLKTVFGYLVIARSFLFSVQKAKQNLINKYATEKSRLFSSANYENLIAAIDSSLFLNFNQLNSVSGRSMIDKTTENLSSVLRVYSFVYDYLYKCFKHIHFKQTLQDTEIIKKCIQDTFLKVNLSLGNKNKKPLTLNDDVPFPLEDFPTEGDYDCCLKLFKDNCDLNDQQPSTIDNMIDCNQSNPNIADFLGCGEVTDDSSSSRVLREGGGVLVKRKRARSMSSSSSSSSSDDEDDDPPECSRTGVCDKQIFQKMNEYCDRNCFETPNEERKRRRQSLQTESSLRRRQSELTEASHYNDIEMPFIEDDTKVPSRNMVVYDECDRRQMLEDYYSRLSKVLNRRIQDFNGMLDIDDVLVNKDENDLYTSYKPLIDFSKNLKDSALFYLTVQPVFNCLINKINEVNYLTSCMVANYDEIFFEYNCILAIEVACLNMQRSIVRNFDYPMFTFFPTFHLSPFMELLSLNKIDEKFLNLKQDLMNQNIHLIVNGVTISSFEEMMLKFDLNYFSNARLSQKLSATFNGSVRLVYYFLKKFLYDMRKIDEDKRVKINAVKPVYVDKKQNNGNHRSGASGVELSADIGAPTRLDLTSISLNEYENNKQVYIPCLTTLINSIDKRVKLAPLQLLLMHFELIFILSLYRSQNKAKTSEICLRIISDLLRQSATSSSSSSSVQEERVPNLLATNFIRYLVIYMVNTNTNIASKNNEILLECRNDRGLFNLLSRLRATDNSKELLNKYGASLDTSKSDQNMFIFEIKIKKIDAFEKSVKYQVSNAYFDMVRKSFEETGNGVNIECLGDKNETLFNLPDIFDYINVEKQLENENDSCVEIVSNLERENTTGEYDAIKEFLILQMLKKNFGGVASLYRLRKDTLSPHIINNTPIYMTADSIKFLIYA